MTGLLIVIPIVGFESDLCESGGALLEISSFDGNRIDRPIGFFMRVSGSSRAQHPRSFSQSSVRNSI